MFESMDASDDTVIRVIGVGSCGCNAVDYMIENGVRGVEFWAINTESHTLEQSKKLAQLTISAPIHGLNESSAPDVPKNDRSLISALIEGAHMVFVIAGMGGETATVVAPVVAQLAKEKQIFTIAAVTTPFAHEVEHIGLAQSGIEELHKYVDSLIVLSNSRLMEVLGGGVTVPEVLKASKGALQSVVADIAGVINVPGLVNVDLADVRTILSENGRAMMGFATVKGPERARVAAECAIASPFMGNTEMSGARGVLVSITSSCNLKLKEISDVMECVQIAAEDATVIVGSVFDESMGDELRVTIIAVGLRDEAAPEELLIGDHMNGFELKDTYAKMFGDIREFYPDFKYHQLYSAIEAIAPDYIAEVHARREVRRNLRYIGCA